MNDRANVAQCCKALSDHIRLAALSLLVILAIAWSLVVLVRPSTTDQVILSRTYPVDVASQIADKYHDEIFRVFQDNETILDYPFDSIASRFRASASKEDQARALAKFLNTRAPGHDESVLLLLNIKPIRASLAQYVDLVDTSYISTTIPVIGLSMGRVNTLVCLSIALAGIYGYVVVHYAYAHNLRAKFGDDNIYCDPSLFTASANELLAFGPPQVASILLLRVFFLAATPAAMALACTELATITPTPDFYKLVGAAAGVLILSLSAVVAWRPKGGHIKIWNDYREARERLSNTGSNGNG